MNNSNSGERFPDLSHREDRRGDDGRQVEEVSFFTRMFSKWFARHGEGTSSAGHSFAQTKKKVSSPVATLFFDGDKKMTIAVLSRHVESLEVYFQCRVEQGTAYPRSPLYYELEGYIRENYTKICRHWQKGCFGMTGDLDTVVLAVGSLEASDKAQRNELMEEREARLKQLHARNEHEEEEKNIVSLARLEEVLEIARLHRLTDDLDVCSIYFMTTTSKLFGRIAARIVQDRLKETHLTLTPFIDGVTVSGYSTFAREESNRLVKCTEQGRAVEYQQLPGIDLFSSSSSGEFCVFGGRKETSSDAVSNGRFSWKCDEIAFENLHRWWGDIVVRDYVGQKLVLSWNLHPGTADALEYYRSNAPNNHRGMSTKGTVTLGTVRVESSPPTGRHQNWPLYPCCSSAFHGESLSQRRRATTSSVILDVERSKSIPIDDVTTSYSGTILVHKVRLDFVWLVRASAQFALQRIRSNYRHIEESRPLLPHEIEYLGHVEAIAAL